MKIRDLDICLGPLASLTIEDQKDHIREEITEVTEYLLGVRFLHTELKIVLKLMESTEDMILKH